MEYRNTLWLVWVVVGLSACLGACDDGGGGAAADTDFSELAGDQDELEADIGPVCPDSGAVLRAAPVVLDFSTGVLGSQEREVLLNNGSDVPLCFEGTLFELSPEDAPFEVRLPEQDGEAVELLLPGEQASVAVVYSPTAPEVGSATLSFNSLNGGSAQVRLNYEGIGMLTLGSHEFEALPGMTLSAEIAVTNEGDEPVYLGSPLDISFEPADVPLIVNRITLEGVEIDRLHPGVTAQMLLTFTPRSDEDTGSALLMLRTENGGGTATEISWKTRCLGEGCEARPVELRCTTDRDAEGLFHDTFELLYAERISLLTTDDDEVVQKFISVTLPEAEEPVVIVEDDAVVPEWSRYSYTYGLHFLALSAHYSMPERMPDGSYEVLGASSAPSFCYYVIDEADRGPRIDFDIHFVGVPGLSAANAETHADWQAVIRDVAAIYESAGLELGDVRYFDVEEPNASLLSIINNESDYLALQALTPALETYTRPESLRMQVFIVQDLLYLDPAVGLSPMPGAAGSRGNAGSAAVVQAAGFLGEVGEDIDTSRPECISSFPGLDCYEDFSGNRAMAEVLVHETGHFLGLPHTSELALTEDGFRYDDFGDTPQCDHAADYSSNACLDEANIMFPVARPLLVPEISEDQVDRILEGPLMHYGYASQP